ncbi:MAG TPA: TIGR03067 domain-containing protein [Gemmataceae bacterium]|jgi:uncharacterized protein (TIGR03067 family)|nr:TIGR03067 domain-containing protein [Gemmataceae bacterium]
MRVTALCGLIVLGVSLAPAADDKGKLDPAKLLGTWTYVSGEKDGAQVPADNLKAGTVEITKDVITLKSPDGKFVIKYKLDASKSPSRIDLEITEGPQGQGSKAEGIIALDGEQLKLCYPAMGGATPKEFKTKEGSGLHLFVLKLKK